MMNFITENKYLTKFLKFVLVTLVILSFWQIFASIENNVYILPGVKDTFHALVNIVKSSNFVKIILSTVLRVVTGLFLGIVFGIVLAPICYKIPLINMFVSPILSIIKSTPVASFIVLLWLRLNGNTLTVLIAFLMVLPIIWQNLMDGFSSVPNDLKEVAKIYNFSLKKKLKCLYSPVLFKYLLPAMVTSSGLAWKSEIATEIIAYTSNSIGQEINNAKYFSNTPEVFAWTIVIIILSLLFEFFTKLSLKKIKRLSLGLGD